jgi:hypothetical protein
MDEHYRRIQEDYQCTAIQIHKALAAVQDFWSEVWTILFRLKRYEQEKFQTIR